MTAFDFLDCGLQLTSHAVMLRLLFRLWGGDAEGDGGGGCVNVARQAA